MSHEDLQMPHQATYNFFLGVQGFLAGEFGGRARSIVMKDSSKQDPGWTVGEA